jgi:predicted MFS family arabinose efflux permease
MNEKRFLTAVALAFFTTQSSALMLAPLLIEIGTEFDVSVAVAGQLATATFVAWAISVVSVGPFSDYFGRRPVALTGLSLLCIGVLGSAFAPNLLALMALRVLTGLGGGMIPPNGIAAVADVVSEGRRARIVGGLMAITNASQVVGLPLVAAVADLAGWRMSFMVMGSLLALCTLLNWFWFPKSEAPTVRSFSFFSRYRQLLNIPVIRGIVAANFAMRLAFMAMFSYLATYLIQDYDMSVGAVALPLALVGLGTVFGSYIGGLVANRRDRMLLVGVSTLAAGAVTALMFSMELPVWAVVAVASIGSGLWIVPWTVLLNAIAGAASQSRATGVGLFGISNQTGAVGGSALGGLLLASIGFPGVGYLCLGAAVLSVAIVALFLREGRAGAKLLPDELS